MSVGELFFPGAAVGPHDFQDINGQTVVAGILKQSRNCVFDAHDLVAEGIHAQLVGELQGLAKVLVGLADVEPFAATVEEGLAQLLGDGFREVVVGLDDDVAVVPGNVEDADARDDGDAGRVNVVRVCGGETAVDSLHDNGKREQHRTLAHLFLELLTHGGLVAPSQLLVGGRPCWRGQAGDSVY